MGRDTDSRTEWGIVQLGTTSGEVEPFATALFDIIVPEPGKRDWDRGERVKASLESASAPIESGALGRRAEVLCTIPKHRSTIFKELWRGRVRDARIRVDFARNFLDEIENDFKSGAKIRQESEGEYRYAVQAKLRAVEETKG